MSSLPNVQLILRAPNNMIIYLVLQNTIIREECILDRIRAVLTVALLPPIEKWLVCNQFPFTKNYKHPFPRGSYCHYITHKCPKCLNSNAYYLHMLKDLFRVYDELLLRISEYTLILKMGNTFENLVHYI